MSGSPAALAAAPALHEGMGLLPCSTLEDLSRDGPLAGDAVYLLSRHTETFGAQRMAAAAAAAPQRVYHAVHKMAIRHRQRLRGKCPHSLILRIILVPMP